MYDDNNRAAGLSTLRPGRWRAAFLRSLRREHQGAAGPSKADDQVPVASIPQFVSEAPRCSDRRRRRTIADRKVDRCNKLLAAGVGVGLVILLILIAVAAAGSGGPSFSDSTSCWDWTGASQAQQDDYGRLYVSEYGELPNSEGDPVGTVEEEINTGCTVAFDFGEGQVVTVVQAINHQY